MICSAHDYVGVLATWLIGGAHGFVEASTVWCLVDDATGIPIDVPERRPTAGSMLTSGVNDDVENDETGEVVLKTWIVGQYIVCTASAALVVLVLSNLLS